MILQQLCLTLTNANFAENISINYILCEKQGKGINKTCQKICIDCIMCLWWIS